MPQWSAGSSWHDARMWKTISASGRFFWGDDRGLSALLAVMVLSLFVAVPLVATQTTSAVLLPGLWSLLLLIGAWAVVRTRLAVGLVGALVVAAAIARWTEYAATAPGIAVLNGSLTVASYSIFAGLILARVFRAGRITIHRIVGAVAVYLLIGMVWSQAYRIVTILRPDALGGAVVAGSPPDEATLLYFSFVTLTTVGYGDITPIHPAARSLAMAESLTGQLFLAILIARLVSQELMSRE